MPISIHRTALDQSPVAPHSPFYQGPFGRLFRNLPPWTPDVPPEMLDAHLTQIANERMLESGGASPPTPDSLNEAQLEQQFGSRIPAGYTYFGQLIDHDITFDPASSLQRANDPEGLLNFRTPRLDLDCVYGRGPADQPYLYDEDDKDLFLIGSIEGSNLRDLPRNAKGRALIGDMRNDENAIVSQLQLALLLSHNKLVSRARNAGMATPFDAARQTLRWLYQWIVWHDFIRRIVDAGTHACALSLEDVCCGGKAYTRGLKDVYDWREQPFMPVEFSVAAYRFGHSMARNQYQTNQPHRGAGNFAPIFNNSGPADPDDLRGFRRMLPKNVAQWDWFLEMNSSSGPFPQRARKIDTKLANALAFLHEGATGDPLNVLARRNLLRGVRLGLPSGTDVANRLGLPPIDLASDEPDALWYYILKEAETLPGRSAGQRLGPVGSIIVCATFAGLLAGDPRSWVSAHPAWTPESDPLLNDGEDNIDSPGDWQLASIIRLAGLPADANAVTKQS